MPLLLEKSLNADDFAGRSPILFVACGVCPRMCVSVSEDEPYFTALTPFRKNDFFARYINDMREELERKGMRTALFSGSASHGMMCLWPQKRRNRLSKIAGDYAAVAVVGCDSAAFTVSASMRSGDVKVVQVMRVGGIANFMAGTSFPLTVRLEPSPEGPAGTSGIRGIIPGTR